MSYHSRIMNIPHQVPSSVDASESFAFRLGHRDARQASAEIAAEAGAAIAERDALIEKLAGAVSKALEFVRDDGLQSALDSYAQHKEPK
jgi:hypothetical protein